MPLKDWTLMLKSIHILYFQVQFSRTEPLQRISWTLLACQQGIRVICVNCCKAVLVAVRPQECN